MPDPTSNAIPKSGLRRPLDFENPYLARRSGCFPSGSRAKHSVTNLFARLAAEQFGCDSGRLMLHQPDELRMQLLARLRVVQIQRDTIHRANFYTLRCFKMPDALGALCRVNLIDLDTLKNRVVGAFRLADIAVDALISNLECQVYFPTLPSSARAVSGCTNSLTSPPSVAISRTIVAEMNMYLSDGVRNMVSTPGLSFRFIPAI